MKKSASLGRYLVCVVVEVVGVVFAWIHTAFRLDVDARASGGRGGGGAESTPAAAMMNVVFVVRHAQRYDGLGRRARDCVLKKDDERTRKRKGREEIRKVPVEDKTKIIV